MYVYDYRSQILTGIPELDNQYSGFELTADLLIQARTAGGLVVMKLNDVKVARLNDAVSSNLEEDIEMVHRYNKEYQRELTKPIRFIHENGKVLAFEADRSEPEWSLNIKKSILSLFNVNLQPKKIMRQGSSYAIQKPISYKDLTYYGLYERGVAGICETIYEVKHMPDPEDPFGDKAFVLNVTKTRNYDNCLTEPTIVHENFDTRGCLLYCRKQKSYSVVPGYYPIPDAVSDPLMTGCPCNHEPSSSPVDQYNYVQYNISNVGTPVIEEVVSEGKIVYTTLGTKFVVSTIQNATLVEKKEARQVSIPQIQSAVRHEELAFRIPIPQLPQGPKLPQDIPFLHIFAAPNYDEWAQILPKVFEKIADDVIVGDVSSTENTMVKVVEAVHQLAVMPIQVLEVLYKEIAQKGALNEAEDKDKVLRQLFLDALPLAGTNNAAIFIKKLIEANLVSTLEAKMMVEALPKHMFLPDTNTIDAYLELCQNPIVQSRKHLFASTCIAFSKLVAEGCVRADQNPGDLPNGEDVPQNKRHPGAQQVVQPADPRQTTVVTVQPSGALTINRQKRSAPWSAYFPQQICQETDVVKYVQLVAKWFQGAQTFQHKLVYLQTLVHMKVPHVLQVLEPYISGRIPESACVQYNVEDVSQLAEECIFVRTSVISSLVPLLKRYPKQVQALTLPVYRDQSEPYQIRLAAFYNVLTTAPDAHILESIASQLHQETNRQIRSYVISGLHHYGNLSIPCADKISQLAFDAKEFAPVDDYFPGDFSKLIVKDFYDEELDYGMWTQLKYISNNISQLPRELTFALREQVGPFQENLVRLSIHQKGFEKFVKRVLEPNGLISDLFEGLFGKQQETRKIARSKRNTDTVQQALASLKKRLNFQSRTDDSPKAEVLLKLFGRTSYYAVNEKEIKSIINELEDVLGDITQALIDGYSGHFVKLFMPGSLEKMVPSEVGLPVIVSHKHPILFSLKVEKAKIDLTSHPRAIYPVGLNFSTIITPQIVYSSVIDVSAVAPGRRLRYGTFVENSIRSAFPVEMKFGYLRPKNLFTASITPKVSNKFFIHTTVPKTYISRSNIASAPEVDSLHDSKIIKSMAVPFKTEGRVGQQTLGLGIHYQLNTEDHTLLKKWFDIGLDEDWYGVANYFEFLYNPTVQHRELHVTLEADQEVPTYGVDATLRYKWIADEEGISDPDNSDQSSGDDESDSDESDSKSKHASKRTKHSKESESQSSETSEESSESTNDSKSKSDGDSSSSESQESKEKLAKKLAHKLRIHRIRKQQEKNSSKQQKSDSSSESKDSDSSSETNEQSDSKSDSKSNSKSNSKENNSKNKSKDSSSSSASSSSESSDSISSSSMEEVVFDYEDVLALILGRTVDEHNIQKIRNHLIEKTRSSWIWAYDEDSDESSSDESSQNEQHIVPATITHDFAITAVARGPRPSYLALNALYIHTLDYRTNWVKFDGHIKTPVGAYINYPNLFCVDAVVAYPPIPGDLSYDPTTLQGLKAKVKTEIGWGPQCSGEGGIIAVGVLENTEDQVWRPEDFNNQDGSNVHHIKDWFYHQCEIDKSEGLPLSYACELAIQKDSLFNRLVLDIKYKHLPKEILNISQQLDLALKVMLYENMENNAIDVDNEKDQLRVIVDYSNKVPELSLVNIHIAKPEEVTNFERVYVPDFRPPSSVYSYSEILKSIDVSTIGVSDSICALMETGVRTFDNVTYNLPETQCQYLVAMDCSPKERWAIFATTLDSEANTKKVTVLTSGQQIKLLPLKQQEVAQVVIDGKTVELESHNPKLFCNGHNCLRIFLQVTKSDAVPSIVVIDDPHTGLKVKYDGKNVKIVTDSKYIGKTCGLCGNNDNESEDELVGPGLCIYDEVEDFVNSYALSGEHCSVVEKPQGKVRCPKLHQQPGAVKRVTKVQTRHQPSGSTTVVHQETHVQTTSGNKVPACQVIRNRYIQRNQMVCFTTRPVTICQSPCIPVGTVKTEQLNFHCLEQASPFTQQLMLESEQTVLTQLVSKRIDFTQSVDVPITCQIQH
ncbi:vitellogenin-like protein [Leptotrombidium deliense]|uniref:Vitellogenin-like protein n=1 Tax=Leptotrombidium deliense TaxID=299467 RepID=A0A443SJZ5_9ACAR|nr:vitellogenin-like protein [Leptotrombidium deliense]